MRKTSAVIAQATGAHMLSLKNDAHASPALNAQQIATILVQMGRNLAQASTWRAVSQEIRKVGTKGGIPKTATVANE
jgi:hypothetical protein